MARDEERLMRSRKSRSSAPADAPGILTALLLTPSWASICVASPTNCSSTTSRAPRPSGRAEMSRPHLGGQRLLLLHGLAGAFATALLETTGDTERVPIIDGIKLGTSDGLDPRCRHCPHRAHRARRAARPDGRGRRRSACRGRHRCRRPARRPDRRRVLDVQPDRRGVPGPDPTGRRGLSGSRIGDRGARLQRPPGQLRPGLTSGRRGSTGYRPASASSRRIRSGSDRPRPAPR